MQYRVHRPSLLFPGLAKLKDDGAAGRDDVGGDDGLAEDAAVEDVADDGELGEFWHE